MANQVMTTYTIKGSKETIFRLNGLFKSLLNTTNISGKDIYNTLGGKEDIDADCYFEDFFNNDDNIVLVTMDDWRPHPDILSPIFDDIEIDIFAQDLDDPKMCVDTSGKYWYVAFFEEEDGTNFECVENNEALLSLSKDVNITEVYEIWSDIDSFGDEPDEFDLADLED